MSNDPTASAPISSKYPHVVVRLMSAVYQRVPLIFGQEGRATSRGIYVPDVMVRSGESSHDFDASERDSILQTIQSIVNIGALRMCVVFSATDCVFIERNAPSVHSNQPPSGGVQFLPRSTAVPEASMNTGPVTRGDFAPTGLAVLASTEPSGPVHVIGIAQDAAIIGGDDVQPTDPAGAVATETTTTASAMKAREN
jgi:hypothetical protein